jgi:hypothetical protein
VPPTLAGLELLELSLDGEPAYVPRRLWPLRRLQNRDSRCDHRRALTWNRLPLPCRKAGVPSCTCGRPLRTRSERQVPRPPDARIDGTEQA